MVMLKSKPLRGHPCLTPLLHGILSVAPPSHRMEEEELVYIFSTRATKSESAPIALRAARRMLWWIDPKALERSSQQERAFLRQVADSRCWAMT
ncbi:hypothetical protein NPIL_100711 [Nephila pilipes]|uniref:Uncharacterized protein n=1 Tax=Nephila pilipes TaxID=299642 RepID=A0A8X6UCR6_NEPPI|nr:hypothetical protein NPIL_100711 [Nephila pilipes]